MYLGKRAPLSLVWWGENMKCDRKSSENNT